MNVISRLVATVAIVMCCNGHLAAQWSQQQSIPLNVAAPKLTVSAGAVFVGVGRNGGGIFRTTNNGGAWTATDSGVTGTTAGNITGLGAANGYVYAGTTDGLLRSADSGKSWKMPSTTIPCCVTSLVRYSGEVYAGALGVYKSTDDGSHWTEVDSGMGKLNVRAFSASGGYLVAGTATGGFYRTSNKGVVWTAANGGLPTTYGSRPVTAFATNNGKLFASFNGLGHGVYVSTNDGTSWSDAGNGITDSMVLSLAAFGGYLYAGTASGIVFRSANNGTTWLANNTRFTDQNITSIISNGTVLFVATGDGVYSSTDSGATWSAANAGITASYPVRSIGVGSRRVFAGSSGAGVAMTTNFGTSWSRTDTGSVTALFYGSSSMFAAHPGSGIRASADLGATWAGVSNGLAGASVYAFCATSGSLFAGTDRGPYVSVNGGVSWTACSTTFTDTVFALYGTGTTVVAGTRNGFFRSKNDGATWTQVQSGGTASAVRTIAGNSTTLFAGRAGDGVYVSGDTGATWSAANAGLPANRTVYAIVATDSLILAGTAANGVYASRDNGAHWTPVSTGLHLDKRFPPTVTDTTVYALAIADTFAYAGTPLGVWRRPLSDIGGGVTIPPDTIHYRLEFTSDIAWLSPQHVVIAATDSVTHATPVAKICADGTSTAVRLTADKPAFLKQLNNLIVRIASPADSLTAGWFSAPVIDSVSLRAQMHHSRPSSTMVQHVVVEVFDTAANVVRYTYPVDIYAPPVVLVPGLAANRRSMRSLADYLIRTAGRYPLGATPAELLSGSDSPLLFFADYLATANSSLAANAGLVSTAAVRALNLVRSLGYSAGRVDIVAHSLGGLLARQDLQSTSYHGEFNRLITVNTPHAGTQMATWAVRHRAWLVDSIPEVREWFSEAGIDLAGDAMRDLDVTGTAIINDMNGGTRNRNRVPSFAIATQATSSATFKEFDKALLDFCASFPGFPTPDSLALRLFNGEGSDFIVPLSSQTGGLLKSQTITGQDHFSLDNAEVRAAIGAVLRGDPLIVCDTGGFHPPVLAYNLQTAKQQSGAGIQSTPALQITQPPRGATMSPGDTIRCVAAGSAAVSRFVMLVLGDSLRSWSRMFSSSGGTFQYVVPPGASDHFSIVVVSADPGGVHGVDTTRYGVRVATSLITLSCPTPHITLRRGDTATFHVIGGFIDSTTHEVTNDALTVATVGDTAVARLVAVGRILGVKPDTTSINIVVRGHVLAIPVTVSDTALAVNDPRDGAPGAFAIGSLAVYPNPASGYAVLGIGITQPVPVEIVVTDMLGHDVWRTVLAHPAIGYHPVVVPAAALPSGVYRCAVRAGTESRTRIISIMN